MSEIILALDLPTRNEALTFLAPLRGKLKWVKVGLQMFTRYGTPWVQEIAEAGFHIFLDLKLHDIPNTVEKAIESLSDSKAELLTIHASGGRAMMEAAVRGTKAWENPPKILAVTVLTSLNAQDCREIGWQSAPAKQVEQLAQLAVESGVGGIVCSPLELADLSNQLPNGFLKVVPGIRPAGSPKNEQQRVLTPAEAAHLGASHLVIGRPLLNSRDPLATLLAIQDSLSG